MLKMFVPLFVFLLASPALAGTVTVQVSHTKLDPSVVTVKAGDAVVFHNTVEMPGGHTIVADKGDLSSPPLQKGASWSHTFVMPGTYGFHIKQHPTVKMKVIVK